MWGRVRLGQLSLRAPSLKASPPPPPLPPTSDVELDLQRSVQAVLRELSAQAPALQSNRGKNQQSSVSSVGSPATLSLPQPALPMHSQESAPTQRSQDEGDFQPSPHPAGSPWGLKGPDAFSAHWLTLPETVAEPMGGLPSSFLTTFSNSPCK